MQEIMTTARVTVSYSHHARPEEVLTTRADSYCHFFGEFDAGEYRVQLRLDWRDRDSNDNPTLDADIYDRVTGKKVRSLAAVKAHHTRSVSGDTREYVWQFEDVDLRLRVEVAWEVRVCDAVILSEETRVVISPPQAKSPSEHR